MEKGLSITIMGMTVVFAVLIVIYISIALLTLTERLFPPPAVPDGPQPRSPGNTSGGSQTGIPTDEEVAAMKAAFSHHLNMKPDQFDLEIK
ncbi:OadG family protein [Myxococcota bacterium]|nr:OadG family protein [Myxococcota bacterium]MBU1536225.1 OadG family protein [Myxococcota bacterium]